MSKIKNVVDLRELALETLERLRNGEIDTQMALVTGKVCDVALNTVKAQFEYSRMIQEENPHIPFMIDPKEQKTIQGEVYRKHIELKR